jgi:hypothetical protein
MEVHFDLPAFDALENLKNSQLRSIVGTVCNVAWDLVARRRRIIVNGLGFCSHIWIWRELVRNKTVVEDACIPHLECVLSDVFGYAIEHFIHGLLWDRLNVQEAFDAWKESRHLVFRVN